jgi:hypothetical protein
MVWTTEGREVNREAANSGQAKLQFWFGRGKLASNHGVGEAGSLVGAVAEGLIRGVAAAAKRNRRAPSQAESRALRIHDFEISFDSNRSIAIDRDFRRCHFSLCEKSMP